MIKDFRHKGLKRLFERGDGAKVQPEHIERLRLWAVRVNGNWRLTFRFIDGDAYVVDYQDYH